MTEDEYMTIRKASAYSGVPPPKLHEAIRVGKLKSVVATGSLPERICKKSLIDNFAKEIEKQNCKKMGLIEAAKFLKVSRIEFYKLIKAGVLKTTGEGFDSQIKLGDLEAYLADVASPKKEDQS